MENLLCLKKYACDYNILVVEDSKHINSKLIEYLARFFYEIDSAYDGLEGYQKFENKRYDIVITDINMPYVDGNGLVQKILDLEPNVQIIVVSAFGHDENLLSFNKFGIVDFIQKPIDNLKLVDALLASIENIKALMKNSNISYSFNEENYQKLLERKNSNNAIELINSYKGVTITHDAFISDINTQTITIQTTDVHHNLIKCEQRTLISIDGKYIRANLQYIDKNTQQLVLKKFENLQRSPKDRKLPRVIPDKSFTLSRYHKGEFINYDVLSLSSKALSIKTSSLDESFNNNSDHDLVLGLEVSYTRHYKASYEQRHLKMVKVRSKAHILRVDKLSDSTMKIVFVLELSHNDHKLLERYIMQRETDILYELDSLSKN